MIYAGTSKKSLQTFTTLEQELMQVHNYRYTYDNAVFINARTPFLITCPDHGDFLQQPRAHKQGQGCRKCFFKANALTLAKDKDTAVAELECAIGDKFNIDKDFEYINAYSLVNVTCKKCGTLFEKPVYACLHHKSNCLECKKRESTWGEARYDGSSAILYYLQIGELFKIGITKNSVATKYKKELSSGMDIKVIFTIEYENGVEAFREEQRILKEYAMYRYYGEKVFLHGGDSELFTVDIMNLKEREE